MFLLACTASPPDSGSDSGSDTGADPATFSAPDEPGPWAAGTSEHTFTDSTGYELTVQAWYPTEDAGSPVRYDDLLDGTATELATPACEAPRPVLLFSHGSGGLRYQSIFLTEHLATHGWIVLAPDHRWSTTFDIDESRLIEVALRRPVEIRDTYDWLLATGADDRLTGCFDPEAGYAMAGHSFGAYTTLVVNGTQMDFDVSTAWCEEHSPWLCDDLAAYRAEHPEVTTLDLTDDRAWAGIPMTPAGYELLLAGLPANDRPFLVWGGELDELTPVESDVRPIYEDLGGRPTWLAVLTGAGHYTFSDACAIAPIFDDCAAPYLPPEEAHPVVRATSLAFLQALNGQTEADAWLPPADAAMTWEGRE